MIAQPIDGICQADADSLLRMEKIPANNDPVEFPDFGGNISLPLASRDQREHFSLDVGRKRIALSMKYQNRARQTIILARLDFHCPHRNPDGAEVGVPHLHLYREGYADKWAYPVPEGMLINPDDHWVVLHDFMRYCRIVEFPNIIRGVFT